MRSIKRFESTECKDYLVTETTGEYNVLKEDCEAIDGKLASEDLKDRLLENSLKHH